MENLVISAFPKTQLVIPGILENASEIPLKAFKRKVTFGKNKEPVANDARLKFLCRNGRLLEAVNALDSISRRGSKVKPSTFIELLQCCINSGSIDLGRILHARIGMLTEADSYVETKLVSMYAKSGCLGDARKVFDSMRERNLYTWSAMIGGYSREQRWREVVELFCLMMEDGVLPDSFLFPKILQACGNCSDVETGKLIHSLVNKLGMVSNSHVTNSILALYAKCGEVSLATRTFRKMDERDEVAWNSLLMAFCQKGYNDEARRLFDEMEEKGIVPGLVTWNILIDGYNQRGQCDAALKIMKKMESLGITSDVFTWTAMISGFSQNGRRRQALDLFREMLLAGIKPNGVTIMSVSSTCASLRDPDLGSEVHCIAYKMSLISDVLVANSLIDMYAKCGELEAARKVFDLIECKDIYSWNSMIAGYCRAGFCGEAYELFTRMHDSNIKPNVITWNTIISGYIQNGNEDEAVDLFQKMEKDGKIKRNTASWNMIIAGYLQNGRKDEALRVFRQMQSCFPNPNSVTILSVLPGCANVLATRSLKEIHGCVLRRNLDSVLAVSNALIDTYAKAGDIAYSRAIFEGMETKDIITWNSLIGGFVLHGCDIPALDLFGQMKRIGLRPNRGTLASIILAHSLAGNVEEGKQVYSSITDEYHIVPALEHYSAMIALYGRSGKLEEAVNFIKEMNIQSEPLIWVSLLTAARFNGNIGIAIHAAEHLLELAPRNAVIQHIVSQTLALSGNRQSNSKERKPVKDKFLKKSLGQSWVEVRNSVYTFYTGDQLQLCLDILSPWVKNLCRKDKGNDYRGELLIEEEDTEGNCGIHSEKFALAFALISSSSSIRTIRIVKNLRMCRDCHNTAKYITKTYGWDIYLNDTKCLHHFKNGHCSCRDYW